MDFLAQLRTDGSGSRPIPDLRNTPLEELALLACDEDGLIHDVVARMVDSGQPLVSATMFNSAIYH
jgi:hypothetical protein